MTPLQISVNDCHIILHCFHRYLHHYERINFFGQDPDGRDDSGDMDDLPSRKKPSGPLGGVALTYNYQQHALSG